MSREASTVNLNRRDKVFRFAVVHKNSARKRYFSDMAKRPELCRDGNNDPRANIGGGGTFRDRRGAVVPAVSFENTFKSLSPVVMDAAPRNVCGGAGSLARLFILEIPFSIPVDISYTSYNEFITFPLIPRSSNSN